MGLREDCNELSKCFTKVAELISEGQSQANFVHDCNIAEAYSHISNIFDICDEGKNYLENCLQQLESIQKNLGTYNANLSNQKISSENNSQNQNIIQSSTSKHSKSEKLSSKKSGIIEVDKLSSNAYLSQFDISALELLEALDYIHKIEIKLCNKYKKILDSSIEFTIKKSATIGIFVMLFTQAYIAPKFIAIANAPIMTLIESIDKAVQYIDSANPDQSQKTVQVVSSLLGIKIEPEQLDNFKASLVDAQNYSQQIKKASGINDEINSKYTEEMERRRKKWKKEQELQSMSNQYLDMNHVIDVHDKENYSLNSKSSE
jgi:hypothetical protein